MSQPLWLVCLLITIAAIAGNQVGYMIGRKAGPAVFSRPESRFFKQEHVDKSYAFFDKYGARAIVLARFVPIVRTFITVMAGVGRMHYRTYLIYTVIGGVLWGAGVTMLGYALGGVDFVARPHRADPARHRRGLGHPGRVRADARPVPVSRRALRRGRRTRAGRAGAAQPGRLTRSWAIIPTAAPESCG